MDDVQIALQELKEESSLAPHGRSRLSGAPGSLGLVPVTAAVVTFAGAVWWFAGPENSHSLRWRWSRSPPTRV